MTLGKKTTTITVASGKGGVGKTNVAVNLAILLSRQFSSVCLLDSDIGMANVDVLLGLESEFSLTDVVNGRCSFAEALIAGPDRLHILSGGTALERYPDLSAQEKENLLQTIRKLQHFALTLIDSPAGASRQVIQLLCMAHLPVVVVTPEPTSITDAYALIKLFAKKQKRPLNICLNRVKSEKQASIIFDKLHSVTRQYLEQPLNYLGYIPDDPHIPYAVASQSPLVTLYPESSAASLFQDISHRVAQFALDMSASQPGRGAQPWAAVNRNHNSPDQAIVSNGHAPLGFADNSPAGDDLLRVTLGQAVHQEATDIHIDPGPESYSVSFRINTRLVPSSSLAPSTGRTLIKNIKSHCADHQADAEPASHGFLRIAVQGRQAMMHIRASFVQTLFGENAVLSFMDRDPLNMGIKDLEMDGRILDSISRAFFRAQSGLFILNGARTSDISKTRSILLEHFTRQAHGKTLSVEKHVRHLIPGVIQVEALEHDRGWVRRLTSTFRSQDVDTVSLDLDETRQSFATAIDLTSQGFKVLVTTHLEDGISALAHFLSFCRERQTPPLGLKGVLSQHCVPGICPSCREHASMPAHLVQFLKENRIAADMGYACGHGCVDCDQSGQKGHVKMYEHLPVNQAMREKLLSGDDYFNIFKTIFQEHLGSSLLDDGLDKVSRGLIKLDDLLALTNECL